MPLTEVTGVSGIGRRMTGVTSTTLAVSTSDVVADSVTNSSVTDEPVDSAAVTTVVSLTACTSSFAFSMGTFFLNFFE